MIKTKIIETTEKYDKDGNIIEKVTREETSEDDGIEGHKFIATNYPTNLPWNMPYVPHCEKG